MDLRPLHLHTHYLSLYALNSSPNLHIHNHVSSRWNWQKTVGSRWTLCHAQNIRQSNHKLKSALKAACDHNARLSQTDRQTDTHHGNSATIRSNERIVR